MVKETLAEDIFIPEEFNEEQRMMAQTCSDFVDTQVIPVVDQLDKHDRELLTKLMKDAGELGILGVSIPEEYEGFGQNFVTSMLTNEEMGRSFSFAVAFSAHSGIGTLPILYYGNKEQKEKYIPKLATGEYIGAYCLTEPDAGSDANSGKSKAELTKDGKHYKLNGVKMWITNGGVADVLIVFAKIGDDKNLTAFIVESKLDGITIGAEEEKMGIRGSSTVQIYFNDVMVPVENMLGEQNGGFKIGLMEKDALVAHGVNSLLKEKYYDHSDGFSMFVSEETNFPCAGNLHKKIFIDKMSNTKIAKVNVPWVYLLVWHMLMTTGITMKIKLK